MNQLAVPIINYFYLVPEEELISTYHPLELSKLFSAVVDNHPNRGNEMCDDPIKETKPA